MYSLYKMISEKRKGREGREDGRLFFLGEAREERGFFDGEGFVGCPGGHCGGWYDMGWCDVGWCEYDMGCARRERSFYIYFRLSTNKAVNALLGYCDNKPRRIRTQHAG